MTHMCVCVCVDLYTYTCVMECLLYRWYTYGRRIYGFLFRGICVSYLRIESRPPIQTAEEEAYDLSSGDSAAVVRNSQQLWSTSRGLCQAIHEHL